MPSGIMYGAMGGLGHGMSKLADTGLDYVAKSQLQSEAAAIQAARDERLAEIRRGEIQFADELRRKPAMDAAAEIEKARGEHVDDLSGTVRPRTQAEMADVESRTYRKHGLVQEAQGVEQTQMQRERDADARLARQRDDNRGDEALAEQKRHNQAVETLQRAQEGRLKAGADVDNAIKQIALDNAKRVEDLRKEFRTAPPERQKQITEEIQLLTGKDNDNYLPVPIKDEAGAITGYHIFDRKRGAFVNGPGAGAPGAPGAKGDRPPLDSFFRKPAAPGGGASSGGGATSGTPAAAPRGLADVLDQQRPSKPRPPVRDIEEEDRMQVP